MPRTVEHLVECHRAASALRAAGKPIWNKEIGLHSILYENQDDESPEHLAAISVRIAALIRDKVPASYFDSSQRDYCADLEEVVESMESCTADSLYQMEESTGIEPVKMFNGWLTTLYDWADHNRVWLGD